MLRMMLPQSYRRRGIVGNWRNLRQGGSFASGVKYDKIRMMANDNEAWSIEFYEAADGTSPPRQFLESLDDKTQARFEWSIRQLMALNVRAREPLVKPLEGKLWELRRGSRRNIYRLLYFFFTGRKIVFVHGFQKKSDKTPAYEIDIARKRMDDYLRQERE